jgi:hypothetical protein
MLDFKLTREILQQVGEGGRIRKDLCEVAIQLVRWEDMAMAMLPDHHPSYLELLKFVQPISRFLRSCAEAKRGKGPLCLNCDTEFSKAEKPYAFLAIGSGDTRLAAGICRSCAAQSNEDLLKIGIREAKKMWTDARELPVSSATQ